MHTIQGFFMSDCHPERNIVKEIYDELKLIKKNQSSHFLLNDFTV